MESNKSYSSGSDSEENVTVKREYNSEEKLNRMKTLNYIYSTMKSMNAEEMMKFLEDALGDDPENQPLLNDIFQPENIDKNIFKHFQEQFIRITHNAEVHGADPEKPEMQVDTDSSSDGSVAAAPGPMRCTCLPESLFTQDFTTKKRKMKIRRGIQRKTNVPASTSVISFRKPKRINVKMMALILKKHRVRKGYLQAVDSGVASYDHGYFKQVRSSFTA